MLDQITPLVLTYNEDSNIGRVLRQLSWASDVVVVDSFSNDETLEIVKDFPQVRVYQREFDTHAGQWNFGLKETAIASEWVLALDADYVLTDEFVEELQTLNPNESAQGYQASFRYCIEGRRIRSGIYPPVTVLYRRNAGFYQQDGHTHRLVVNGALDKLNAPILHDDRKPISRWFEAQVRYTKLEADKLLSSDPRTLGWKDRIRRWRVVAPVAVLFYCLILRGGILDGWPGWYYAFQRLLAESMLSLYLIDHYLRRNFGIRIANFEFNQPRKNADTADKNKKEIEQLLLR